MSEKQHTTNLTQYLQAFVEGLRSQGIQNIVISPGSRSTPLALMCAAVPDWRLHIQIDERAAAFYALGIAKRTQQAVVLLCTSGTAAANYFPAIVEAKLSEIPLLVLTTDRPHELRDVGAPQTIDQLHLYGHHVKDFVEMALPEANETMLTYARWQAEQAVQTAKRRPAAAVQLNFPFREPLIPELTSVHFAKQPAGSQVLQVTAANSCLQSEALVQDFAGKKGLIVVGASPNTAEFSQVIQLAQKWKWPILADPLSNLRTEQAACTSKVVLTHYDSFLKVDTVKARFQPEVVLRFGQMPVSKPLTQWLSSLKETMHYLVDPSATRKDPIRRSKFFLEVEPQLLIQSLIESKIPTAPESWLTEWQAVEQKTQAVTHLAFESRNKLDEGRLIHELQKSAPKDAIFFISNSMPIRDFDSYFTISEKPARLFANRGANGIDGILATAQGMQSQGGKVYVVVGDVAFAHDLSSLITARRDQLDLTILLINNNGGGIFSFLPQADHPDNFERLFGTPLPLDAEKAAALFAAAYVQPKNWDEFTAAMAQSTKQKGLQLIEIQTVRTENVVLHREIDQAVARQLSMDS